MANSLWHAIRRAGDPSVVYADSSKARATLGWQVRHGLEDIVTDAWKWHSTHPDGFK
jgi:UDP-glucose 4-epimerase